MTNSDVSAQPPRSCCVMLDLESVFPHPDVARLICKVPFADPYEPDGPGSGSDVFRENCRIFGAGTVYAPPITEFGRAG